MDFCVFCFYWSLCHPTHGWQRVDFGASRVTHTLTFRERVPLSAHAPPFITIAEIDSALLGTHLPHVWSVLSQIRALLLQPRQQDSQGAQLVIESLRKRGGTVPPHILTASTSNRNSSWTKGKNVHPHALFLSAMTRRPLLHHRLLLIYRTIWKRFISSMAHL